jgi:hypothetical protein
MTMVAPLFALPPPGMFEGQLIGFLLIILMIGTFVKLTANRKRGTRAERNRRAGLGLLAMCCGPLAGAGLAALTVAISDVHSLDVAYPYYVFTIIGTLAGFVSGIAFAVTVLFSPQSDGPGKLATKSPGPFDDL